MKNINSPKKGERVEVMALFNYSQQPCQPLSFRKQGGNEIEITDTVRQTIRFVGDTTKHIFECIAGRSSCQLEFDASSLAWTLYGA